MTMAAHPLKVPALVPARVVRKRCCAIKPMIEMKML
jgi:hypothetical protein